MAQHHVSKKTGYSSTRRHKTTEPAVAKIKAHTDLPVAVGFGVRTSEQAYAIAKGADGVVVGSALVDAVKNSLDEHGAPTAGTAKALHDIVRDLAGGIKKAAGKN